MHLCAPQRCLEALHAGREVIVAGHHVRLGRGDAAPVACQPLPQVPHGLPKGNAGRLEVVGSSTPGAPDQLLGAVDPALALDHAVLRVLRERVGVLGLVQGLDGQGVGKSLHLRWSSIEVLG